jgi:hypothetical protein
MKNYQKQYVYEVGVRFNNFTLKEKSNPIISKTGYKYSTWKCVCDCGSEFIVTTKAIRKGQKSCGCLSKHSRFKPISDEEFFTTMKINHYKISAERRGIKWVLSREFVSKLINGDCNYCGSKPLLENKHRKHRILLNGIDRVDSNKGYVKGNVVSCCKFCNFAKGNSSLDEFNNWISRLIKFRTI